MMTIQDVLSVYAAMADLTEQMVQAAKRSDWDALVLLEQRCAAHVQTLREHEPPQPMSGAERERKIELIRQMLNADRQIRDLTMPWMAQLSKLINATGTERRIVTAYGSV
ncbi:flagellar protein FliT [Duganella sp. CF402]|uniref:flagellar protein FliT n=1 Tax=unclassified Duganella TaxID=2636909 RepID=UPI0008B6CDB3|nr:MULTISPECIES: flagellar protein FliT [unclassified Duganella]RZT09030.1 flagellar protein FliT [Duganella sp. BK701]SEL73037.1 flagellar protein FliT [Duganella sp. CF402]